MDSPQIRPWYRIHRSTLVVLALVVAWLVFINIPGDQLFKGDRSPVIYKLYHGWPYHYFERQGSRSDFWSFEGASTQFHVAALLLNVLAAICIVALAACATELWIRRYGRLLRFGIMSVLVLTAILAVGMGLGMREIRQCLRQEQVLRELADFGSVTTTRKQREYDWFRSLFGADLHGSIQSVRLSARRPIDQLPDLSILKNVEQITLEGMTKVPNNVEQLMTLPNLGILHFHLTSFDSNDLQGLRDLAEIRQLSTLQIDGEAFDDTSLEFIPPNMRLGALTITSSRLTPLGLKRLSELPDLSGLSIIGRVSPKQDARVLQDLCPNVTVSFGTTPNGKNWVGWTKP